MASGIQQWRQLKEKIVFSRIQFRKMSNKKADAVLARIEDLIAAKVAGYPMEQSPQNGWLVSTRESQVKIRLVDFVSQYIEKRSDVKPSARTTWGRTLLHTD